MRQRRKEEEMQACTFKPKVRPRVFVVTLYSWCNVLVHYGVVRLLQVRRRGVSPAGVGGRNSASGGAATQAVNSSMGELPVWERLQQVAASAEEERQLRAQLQQQQELEGCTFEPNVGLSSYSFMFVKYTLFCVHRLSEGALERLHQAHGTA
jgi:hypothetical protein